MLKTNKGFSLVEIMVAIGLLGALSYFMMQAFERMTELESRVFDIIDATPLLQRAGQEFVLGGSCANTLKQNINDKNEIPAKGELESIFGLNRTKLLTAGDRVGRLEVNKITYGLVPEPKSNESFNNKQQKLEVLVDYSGRSPSMKNKILRLSIPVLVDKKSYEDATIRTCLTYDAAIKEQVKFEIMQELNQSVNMSPEFLKELQDKILKLRSN